MFWYVFMFLAFLVYTLTCIVVPAPGHYLLLRRAFWRRRGVYTLSNESFRFLWPLIQRVVRQRNGDYVRIPFTGLKGIAKMNHVTPTIVWDFDITFDARISDPATFERVLPSWEDMGDDITENIGTKLVQALEGSLGDNPFVFRKKVGVMKKLLTEVGLQVEAHVSAISCQFSIEDKEKVLQELVQVK